MQKIALIGNCQTLALSVYVSNLPFAKQCFWLCPTAEWEMWLENPAFAEHSACFIFESESALRYLSQADCLIWQKIILTKSVHLNLEAVPSHLKVNCKQVTIPCIYYKKSIGYDEMRKKEKEKDTDLQVTAVLDFLSEQRTYDDLMHSEAHPTSFLLLEVVRKLCAVFDWPFFTADEYKKMLKLDILK